MLLIRKAVTGNGAKCTGREIEASPRVPPPVNSFKSDALHDSSSTSENRKLEGKEITNLKVHPEKSHVISAGRHTSMRDLRIGRSQAPIGCALLQVFRLRDPIAWYTTYPSEPLRRENGGAKAAGKSQKHGRPQLGIEL